MQHLIFLLNYGFNQKSTRMLETSCTENPSPGFPGGSMVKNLSANAGDMGLIPGSGRSPGKGNGTYSSILAWRIPWTEEPGGLQSMSHTVR